MTDPAEIVVLDAVVTVPTTRLAPVIAVVALACVRPTTFGTATCGGPDETTSATALPTFTCVAAVGFWLITDPDGTVVLDAVVTEPTVRPAVVIADVAATCVWPTTFGTATCGGPDETTSATALPMFTCVAAVGFWLITDPDGTVVLDTVVTEPTVRPAVVIADVAATCVRPTTFGTATCDGPDETTSATALPAATCDPAMGLWLMTTPAGTVLLADVVTPPRTRPAPVMASVAAVCVKPTTFGTVGETATLPTTISTAAAFQRSLVGAVSLIVVTVPAFATAAVGDWTQNVAAAAVSIHWWTIT